MAQSLRQCTVPSRARLSTRKANTLAPTRVVSIRADAGVNAAAVDAPPKAASSSSKEKVKIGINGKYGICARSPVACTPSKHAPAS